MVSNLSTTNRPPKEAIEKACALMNKAQETNYWEPDLHAHNTRIIAFATVIAERNALKEI